MNRRVGVVLVLVGCTVGAVLSSLASQLWQTRQVGWGDGSSASTILNKHGPLDDEPGGGGRRSSGRSFRGERIRAFQGRRFFQNQQHQHQHQQQSRSNTNSSFDDGDDDAHGKLTAAHPPEKQDGEEEDRSDPQQHQQEYDDERWTPTVACDNWIVLVATDDLPGEAVLRAARVDGWCTVIVGHAETPLDYGRRLAEDLRAATVDAKKDDSSASSSTSMPPHVHFLSVSDQHGWLEKEQRGHKNGGKVDGSAVAAFLRSVLLDGHEFGRKNVAYLYAIQRGARLIFDLDNDHMLPLDTDDAARATTGRVLPPLSDVRHLTHARMVVTGPNAFNPDALMKMTTRATDRNTTAAPPVNTWPRGFPTQKASNVATRGGIAYDNVTLDIQESIGVMQYSTSMDTRGAGAWSRPTTHRNADPTVTTMPSPGALVVPSHAFVPYNAQATVHTRKAFWALLLPRSVPTGSISEILRGYFTQGLSRDLGLNIAVLPPDVEPAVARGRVRNGRKEEEAERNLSANCGTLLEFLGSWGSRTSARTVPERMEELWIDLYERDYIGLDDVEAVQLWLAALIEIQYGFPPVKRHRLDHTVLMGQFNYDNGLSDVLFWHQKWREWFNRIVVRGPFSDRQLLDMRSHGIMAFKGGKDKGFYSPVENLMLTLNDFASVDGVKGVLYLHDDALLNISHIPLGSETILRSGSVSMVLDNAAKSKAEYSIHPNGSYTKVDGFESTDSEELSASLRPWFHWGKCILPFKSAYDDPRSIRYREPDGSFSVVGHIQADFLYVPTSLADEFADAARLMLDHKVFLECGVPKIVDMLVQTANATVLSVSLYTKWNETRGTTQMLSASPVPVDMVHPFKMSRGYAQWSDAFDWLTTSKAKFAP